jgi:ribose transport system permease protein
MTPAATPSPKAETPAGTTEQPLDDRGLPPASRLASWLRTRSAWILLLDVGLIVLFAIVTPDHVFWSVENTKNLLLSLSEGLLLALGLTMMLGAGIFDLSLGANLVLSSVVGAKVMLLFQGTAGDAASYHPLGLAIVVGAAACMATGLLFGLINGLIIAVGGVNSLIATLATLGIGTGIADLITQGTDVGGLPASLQSGIGQSTIFNLIPVPAIAALVAFGVLWVVVRYLRYGLRVQAIGSSSTAAERAGVRVRAHLISLTMLAGGLAGIAAFIDLSRFASTSLPGHANDALNAVTAAVIGGTLLEGGRIAIVGTLWGACLAVILQTGLVLSGVSAYWQLIVVGGVLLIAVLLDRIALRRRASAHS